MQIEDQVLISLLQNTRTIAVVGLSPKEGRDSHRVALYMRNAGYRIIPVRPGTSEILGEKCYASLEDIPKDIPVDLVNVFRRGEETPPVARSAVAVGARALWLQKGIVNDEAQRIATEGNLVAVQDLCIMVEHRRLYAYL